eukprot:Nitzschia sp. Nitz4//NODE_159_length_47236_cov_74.723851//35096//35791//NITZ4_additional_000013-RA//-1//CDS//3329531758//9198//frame0
MLNPSFKVLSLLLWLAAKSSLINTIEAVNVGDTIPDVDLHYGFPPERINVKERIAGKKVILVPGYLEQEDALKALGVDEVLVYCVNDGAVMSAWAESQGVSPDSLVTLMGDPYGELTEQLDMELIHSGPKEVGLINRCKRFALYLVDGVVQIVRLAEKEDDPAGDAFPDATLAEAMIEAIQEFGNSSSDEL